MAEDHKHRTKQDGSMEKCQTCNTELLKKAKGCSIIIHQLLEALQRLTFKQQTVNSTREAVIIVQDQQPLFSNCTNCLQV